MILPQKNSKIIDSSVLVNDVRQNEYINRKVGGAFNFGFLAPGEPSKTIITYLSLSGIGGMKNIKFCLSGIGDIDFKNSSFGYQVEDYLDTSIVPKNSFNGINSSLDKNSKNNIVVGNRSLLLSKFLYLNVTLPRNKILQQGAIRYSWFFDHDGDTTNNT